MQRVLMAEAVQYDKLTSVPYKKMNVTTCHGLLGGQRYSFDPPTITLGGQLTTLTPRLRRHCLWTLWHQCRTVRTCRTRLDGAEVSRVRSDCTPY